MDERSMRKFNEFINSNELVDLSMDGNQFTWFRGGSQVSASKLDRFLVSTELLTLLPNHFQTSISRKLSDHTPVILKVVSYTVGPRPFKWFSHWAEDPEFNKMMVSVLTDGQRRGFGQKLRAVKVAIKGWVAGVVRAKDTETVESKEKEIDLREGKLYASVDILEAMTEDFKP
ncbi:hypothetical protein V6N11_069517 [Hibiscus sabdariffa]|uniref:Uncharacterized protein n=1 Tax=Hibiscus sabdariffa TaxID=183260 RepID=A0ABR2Q317_9ROSI